MGETLKENDRIGLGEYRQIEGFDEQEPEPEVKHYRHPIDPTVSWCGNAPMERKSFLGSTTAHVTTITCVPCLHLFSTKGGKWWWRVHQVWYGTVCSPQHGHSGCT
jgi:hypothetical protein